MFLPFKSSINFNLFMKLRGGQLVICYSLNDRRRGREAAVISHTLLEENSLFCSKVTFSNLSRVKKAFH